MSTIGTTRNVVLYSTNTWLAYNIAERYFGGAHYVWCTPYFKSDLVSNVRYTVAPTSSPRDIYVNLYKEVLMGDRHSTKIEDNKVGILKGAAFKRSAGVITEQEESDIGSIVRSAERRDFKPLLYIIPFDSVAGTLKNVPLADLAHPLSVEYVIEGLPRAAFDVIEIEWN